MIGKNLLKLLKLYKINGKTEENENFNDPLTAGFWSRWYLWNLPTKKASLEDLKRRFKL